MQGQEQHAEETLQPLSQSEWRVFLALLERGRPTLFAELYGEFGGARTVLIGKLDRCVGKGWVRTVPTDSGAAAELLERAWKLRGSVGRRPSIAYETALTVEAAATAQADRLIEEWDLADEPDRKTLRKAIAGALGRRVKRRGEVASATDLGGGRQGR